jgi:hypothetical protein
VASAAPAVASATTSQLAPQTITQMTAVQPEPRQAPWWIYALGLVALAALACGSLLALRLFRGKTTR